MGKSEPRARLDDPDEHFPYKRDDALDAVDNPPDDLADQGEHPHLTADIVEASAAMVEAQRAHLEDPDGEDARAAYEQAKDDLVIARQFHRSGRTGVRVTGNA